MNRFCIRKSPQSGLPLTLICISTCFSTYIFIYSSNGGTLAVYLGNLGLTHWKMQPGLTIRLKLIGDFQWFREFSFFLKNSASCGNLKLFDGKTVFWHIKPEKRTSLLRWNISKFAFLTVNWGWSQIPLEMKVCTSGICIYFLFPNESAL